MALTNECKDLAGRTYWADELADAVKAVAFALHYEKDAADPAGAMVFLQDWNEGDVSAWPEFVEFVQRVGVAK